MQASWEMQSAEPPGRFQWATSLTTGYADLLGIILNSLRFVINVAVMLVAAFLVSPVAPHPSSLSGSPSFSHFARCSALPGGHSRGPWRPGSGRTRRSPRWFP